MRNSSGPAGDEKTKDTPLSPLAASKSLPPRGDRPIDLTRPRGLVELLTGFGEGRSSRKTRIPALGGALAVVSALTDRRFIISTKGFLTSPGLQVVVVGGTGTGKETARDVVFEVCAHCEEIGLAETYASDVALHRALNNRPTQLWANDEFGRFMKSAAIANSGAHDFKIVTMSINLDS